MLPFEKMDGLEYPDLIYLSAAQGWLELGNGVEASAELDHVSPAAQAHPHVVELRWQLLVKAKDWEGALRLAEELCGLLPESAFVWIHRSYCFHELKRTQEACDSLLPQAERFTEEWLIGYNLACYACQLGRLDEAKDWLKRAGKSGNSRHIRQLAAKDADLKPLFTPSSKP